MSGNLLADAIVQNLRQPSDFHFYVLFIAHYDGEGMLGPEDGSSLVSEVVETFVFQNEPTAEELKRSVGECLRRKYQEPNLARLREWMFFHHENYTGWGSDREFLPIEQKITQNLIPHPTDPNLVLIDVPTLMEILSAEEIYEWFFKMVEPMDHAVFRVEKLEIGGLTEPRSNVVLTQI